MGKLCWVTWVGSICNHKWPFKREAEEDLPKMEKAMKQKLESGALKMKESAISQVIGMATRSLKRQGSIFFLESLEEKSPTQTLILTPKENKFVLFIYLSFSVNVTASIRNECTYFSQDYSPYLPLIMHKQKHLHF